MDENDITRKMFSAIGKAAGASQEEIVESWSKCSPDDLKMLTGLAMDLKEIFRNET